MSIINIKYQMLLQHLRMIIYILKEINVKFIDSLMLSSYKNNMTKLSTIIILQYKNKKYIYI
jgi:hypothetical protein